MSTPPTYYFKVYDNISTNGSVGEKYNIVSLSVAITNLGNWVWHSYLMQVSGFQENLGKPLPNINYAFSSDYIEKWLEHRYYNVMKTKLNSYKLHNFDII